MNINKNRREIINRRTLSGRVTALTEQISDPVRRRAVLASLLKDSLQTGREAIKRAFQAGAKGPEVGAANSYLFDQLITIIFEYVDRRVFPAVNPTAADRLALIAVGGYGRGEMAPFSDVDLSFLHPWKLTPRAEQVVEYVLYLLWDLGLTVGYATRSIDESVARAKKDTTICTSLLEARLVCGEQPLFLELKNRFENEVISGGGASYLAAKLAERNERHAQMGDSRYVLEPNVKDGKGGLRDLHTLFWIAQYLYRIVHIDDMVTHGVLTAEEIKVFRRAHRFLWTVRFHLHYSAKRAEDRLTFDQQLIVAKAMNFTDRSNAVGVERFMKYYYRVVKDVGNLTRIFCAALEVEHQHRPRLRLPWLGATEQLVDGFIAAHGRLNIIADDTFDVDPVKMIELFRVAQRHELDVHPHALRLITRSLTRIDARLRANPLANRYFLEILTSRKDPGTTLRRMNEAGVLGRFILDFGRVVSQMQYDMYHVYTVDEHTVFAVGILSGMESGEFTEELPLATKIVGDLLSREVLYLALFLHDIGKGRGGNHSIIGAQIARKLGPRLGLSFEDTETVAWLVEHHLLFSNTAFKRDIGDPRTVQDFVEVVQSLERLRLLLVLTVADIRAVGPRVWNGWKGQLMRDLYDEAAAELSAGRTRLDRKERVKAAKDALRAALTDWPEDKKETHVGRGYPSYWLSFDTDSHARHANFIRYADEEQRTFAFDARVDHFRAVTEITIYCPDHHGLFAGIAGAMAVSGANIVDARVSSTTDGMALDVFWIQDAAGGSYERPEHLERLATTIEKTLTRDFKPARALAELTLLPTRTNVFTVAPRVLVDNNASATYTVVEVNARDRAGLLYDITRTLGELRLSVGSARITTYGVRAVDVFYVKDMFGMKIMEDIHITQIQKMLLNILAEPNQLPSNPETAATAAE